MTVLNCTKNLVLVIIALLYLPSITYELPVHAHRRSHAKSLRHRAIASSQANNATTVLEAVKRMEGNDLAILCASQECRAVRMPDSLPRSDEPPLLAPFNFFQAPWDIESVTSMTMSLDQQGVETYSGTLQPTMTDTVASAQSTNQIAHSEAMTGMVVAAYYADWASEQLAPEDVDFSRFNWIDFAFAIPNENFELYFTQTNSEDLLHRLVAAAHAQGRSVKLSIGGWTGSGHFSRAVGTVAGRAKLCRSIIKAYAKFNLDGIDIDWEYPNQPGAGNEHSADDTANFLKFLKRLRKKLPPSARITAATQVWPFAGKDGQPLGDASGFAQVLDWVLIMNYDVWGSSPNPGPNAPLSDGCGNSTQPLANAEAAIRSWTNAGFASGQLVLGVPAYGYVSRSDRQRLAGRDEISGWKSRRGITMEMSAVEVKSEEGGSEAGQVQFNQLVKQGALVRNNGGEYGGAGGFERRWDSCSSTPFLRSEVHGQVITYDDPESMRLKGELVIRTGTLGVNMFDAHGDDGWSLVDGARLGLGIDPHLT